MGRPVGSTNKVTETVQTVETTHESEGKIQFFSEIDMDDHGNITSEMPVWYFDAQIEELREGIGRKERALERGFIIQEQIPLVKEELIKERAKLKRIKQSKPELKGANKDKAWRTYESLGKQIKDSMPTRKQAHDGLVNPHEELKRLKGKHVKIDTEIAKACGVNVIHGKVTGDEANKCYQILGRALGENSNPEALRRDGNIEAYQSMNDLTQAILKGVEVRGM